MKKALVGTLTIALVGLAAFASAQAPEYTGPRKSTVTDGGLAGAVRLIPLLSSE